MRGLASGRARPSRLATLAVAALLATACGDGSAATGVGGLPPVYAGGSGASEERARDPALVGTWTRTLIVTDSSGLAVLSETRWSFAADGRALRRLVTVDLRSGFGDELVTNATWFTTGSGPGAGVVTIRLEGETGAGTSFDYRVTSALDGARLELGSLTYQRVEP
ncbi:MAG TPA: hypothetical protein VGE02_12050 [Gemmatimonadales bacterium]